MADNWHFMEPIYFVVELNSLGPAFIISNVVVPCFVAKERVIPTAGDSLKPNN